MLRAVPGWTFKNGARASYKDKREKAYLATTPIKGIVIKDGRGVTIQGEATGVPLDGARDMVAIRVTIGDVRSCARFAGGAVTKDVPGAFLGKNASVDGIADCGVAALTETAPTCGNGEVDQPSEECDGAACAVAGFESEPCRPAGAVNECRCCTTGGPSILPCCNPSSIAIFYPPASKVCIPSGCTAPDVCRSGDQCQPDESCCTTDHGNLCLQAYAPPLVSTMVPLVPCCRGLECGRLALPSGATCCASGGTSCSTGADCCTGHCQPDDTCEPCRAGGLGCGSPAACCSGSCTSGTCDACAAAGVPCTSNAACCSGTCASFQCQP